MARSFTTLLAAGAATAALAAAQAGAADKVRFINSTKVVFEMEHAYSAKENGVFDRMGLDVSIIHGSGGAATLQTIITGSQDMAFGVGVLSVIAAYAKGAPVRILGSTKRGTGELYWYVKPDSPLKSFRDLDGGKDLVYSRPGSTTHLTVLYLKDALKLDAKLVSVGGPSGSRTQLMSGQVATGWSVFPLNGNLLRENKIRVIGTGKEAAGLNGVTLRVVAANSDTMRRRPGRRAAERIGLGRRGEEASARNPGAERERRPGGPSAAVRVPFARDTVLEDADVGPLAEHGDERIVRIEAELPGVAEPRLFQGLGFDLLLEDPVEREDHEISIRKGDAVEGGRA